MPPLNQKVPIEVRGRRFNVDIEGLVPLEINHLAQQVSDRMEQIERESKETADTGRLAVLTALEFAAELYRLKAQHESQRLVEDRKLDELTLALQKGLEPR